MSRWAGRRIRFQGMSLDPVRDYHTPPVWFGAIFSTDFGCRTSAQRRTVDGGRNRRNGSGTKRVVEGMKRIGFLSFGHWGPVRGSHTRTARDALLQGIDLAVAAEEIGIDGAFFRVHHFARQQASPFPLLAAVASRTSRVEMGTAVVYMRYENPLYMA